MSNRRGGGCPSQGRGGVATSCSAQPPLEYTHRDHLGAGVFRASAEARVLYTALAQDVAAHAAGASVCHEHPGVVEMQQALVVGIDDGTGMSCCGDKAGAASVSSVLLPPAQQVVRCGGLPDVTVAAVRRPRPREGQRRTHTCGVNWQRTGLDSLL